MMQKTTDHDAGLAETYSDWCRAHGLVGESPAARRKTVLLDYERLIERTRTRAKHAPTDRDKAKIAAKLDRLDELHSEAWRAEHEPPFAELAGREYECRRCGRSLGAGREGRRAAYNQAGCCRDCFHGTQPVIY
jgi:hypothetical protein